MSLDGVLWFLNFVVLVYFVALNSSYLLLVVIATLDVGRLHRRVNAYAHDDMFANPLTPPITIIVPAHNEENVIVESVRAMLALEYSEYEVIVVDDGSTDATFARLQEAFDLQRVHRVVPGQVRTIGEITGTYAPVSGEPLLVVRKVSAGLRADAVNAGLDLARYPLVCMVDADSILETTALVAIAKPFVDDPGRVVAAGGVINIANGSSVYRGGIEDARHGRSWLARIQSVEYTRSFLLGRIGWSRLGSLLIISGAFGLFRRDVLLEFGGLDPKSLGEDAELVTSIHEHMRKAKRDYRVVLVPDSTCCTELPETFSQLATQRRRWSRGLAQLVRKHRKMIGRPRYWPIGVVGLPYYIAFELLGPIVEVGGVVLLGAGLLTGVVTWWFALAFAIFAVGYGLVVSCCALTIEELSFHRYRRWTDLQRSFLAAVAENFGYRQLHAWWRLRGLVDEVRGKETAWGAMVRRGFDQAVSEVPAARVSQDAPAAPVGSEPAVTVSKVEIG
jgi:cellulose synthase/poly-beta-1,6-N-acetylglucosamine synthase-like glycosyltransferase